MSTRARGINDGPRVAARVVQRPGSLVSTVARTPPRPAPDSPLNVEIGTARRFVMVGTDLDDYRKVRSRLARGAYAEDVTINDVSSRRWPARSAPGCSPAANRSTRARSIRSMVPVSI